MVFSCYQGMVQGKLFSFFPVFSSVALLSDCLHCHSNTNISTPSHPCINLSQKPLRSKDRNTIHVMLLESSRKDSTYASERLCIISHLPNASLHDLTLSNESPLHDKLHPTKPHTLCNVSPLGLDTSTLMRQFSCHPTTSSKCHITLTMSSPNSS